MCGNGGMKDGSEVIYADLLLKEMFFEVILRHQIFLCLLLSTLSTHLPSIPPVAVAELRISVL